VGERKIKMEKEKKKLNLKIIIPVIAIIITIIIVAVAGIGVIIIRTWNKKQNLGESLTKKELATSKYVDLRGIYVDKSDEKTHPDEALIYVLYTVKSDDKNIEFYTYMANNPITALTIKINNVNEYKDTIYRFIKTKF